MSRPRLAVAAALAAAALVALLAPIASAAPATLTVGFFDNAITSDPDAASRDTWLGRMTAVGATRVRIGVSWAGTARRAPAAGENPADPSWPGYDWRTVDTAIGDAIAHGLDPLFSFGSAPSWAEGPRRPRSAPRGSWKPDPDAVAAFARAAALRYPQVRHWQVWNEPNLSNYLTPQWVDGAPASPSHYRAMLNAAYDAIKSVNPANVVLTAGTAPFGDLGHEGARMPPARFVRDVLCLKGVELKLAPCATPAKFDVLAHHPYSVRGPRGPALNVDDVSVPDMAKLVKPLRRAEANRRALPAIRHGVWVTEVSWDSAPADPDGVPEAKHANWVQDALYVLWLSGVDNILWWLARDQAPTPSYGATYQSGMYLRDGTPKLSATAFRFPFVADKLPGGRVRLWTKAPAAGRIVVQKRAGGRWVTVTKWDARAPGAIVKRTVKMKSGTRLRAQAAGSTSLTWTVARTVQPGTVG